MPGLQAESAIDDPNLRVLVAAVGDAVGVVTAERRERVAASLGAVDWGAFAELVRHHGVAPLVRRSRWFTDVGAPASVHEKLHHLARRSSARALRTVAILDELVELFAADDIDFLVLDGLPFTAWAYGDPMARQTGDLDVLVAPGRVADAAALLLASGFEVMPHDVAVGTSPDEIARLVRRSSSSELGLTGHGLFVDLRWRLFDNAHLLPVPALDGAARRTVDVGGAAVPTLAAEPAWWYTAVNGTQRRWSRLRWVADVPAVLATAPGLVARPALERAEAAGVDRCVATALAVSESLFGAHLDDEVRSWIAARPGTERLGRIAHRALADVPAGERGRLAEAVATTQVALGLRGDHAYRREEVRQALERGARGMLLPEGPLGRIREQAAPLAERARRELVRPAGLAAEAGVELVRAFATVRRGRAPAAHGTVPAARPDIDLTDRAALDAATTHPDPDGAGTTPTDVASAIGVAVARAARLLAPVASPLCRAVAADRMLGRRSIDHHFHPGSPGRAEQGEPCVLVEGRAIVGRPATAGSPGPPRDVS